MANQHQSGEEPLERTQFVSRLEGENEFVHLRTEREIHMAGVLRSNGGSGTGGPRGRSQLSSMFQIL